MNHCQNYYSCISCCGLFNYKLTTEELYQLLQDRTNQISQILKNKQDFPRSELLMYRYNQEQKECVIEKYNDQIYVCPFLGFIHQEEKRMGCLIHPTITGEEKSQDVSFYGSSICLSYDCRVKEDDESFIYKKIVQKIIRLLWEQHKEKILWIFFKNESVKNDGFVLNLLYSRFIGDYIFYTFVKSYYDLEKIHQNQELMLLFLELCLLRLEKNYSVTSFEINYDRFIEKYYFESFRKIFFNESDDINLVQKFEPLLKIC